jgi:hypothetical protein
VRFYRFAKWKCRRPISDWGTSAGTLDKAGRARLPFAEGDGARDAEPENAMAAGFVPAASVLRPNETCQAAAASAVYP